MNTNKGPQPEPETLFAWRSFAEQALDVARDLEAPEKKTVKDTAHALLRACDVLDAGPLPQPEGMGREALPSFVRRPIEEAIDRAVNPKGMSVHDGKIHGLASDKVAYLLAAYDRLAAHPSTPENSNPLPGGSVGEIIDWYGEPRWFRFQRLPIGTKLYARPEAAPESPTVAWLYTSRSGHVQAFTSEPPPSMLAEPNCEPLVRRSALSGSGHPETFEDAWEQMKNRGYGYGEDALQNVRLGWRLAKGEI